jgi:hypothetical protein
MRKSTDKVNYVVTGSRYQVTDSEGKTLPEFGVGKLRSGIQLDLALKLYVEMVTERPGLPWNGETKATARQVAATAFALSEVFLDELDKHFRTPPPPPPSPPENNSVKIRK